jgi:outer membrane protein TolC
MGLSTAPDGRIPNTENRLRRRKFMHGMRIALVGLLCATMGLAWAEPHGKNRVGEAMSKLGRAISVRDWAAPTGEDVTAQAPAQDSPIPEENAAAPQPAPATPAPEAQAETPPPPPAPLEPVKPLEPVAPVTTPAPAPAAEPATPQGPSLLQRAIKLKEVDVDELYRNYQSSFPRENLELSLKDCVHRALKANQEILVTMYEPLKAGADEFAAHGEFDPQLFSQAQYTYTSQTASSEVVTFGGITAIESYQTTSQSGVQGKLPWGTQYNVALGLSKEESTYTQMREQWFGGLNLNLTQPLLRGFGKSANRARIEEAANSRDIAENQLRSTVLTAVSDTVKAYWDLVGAIENVEARQKAVENAQRTLEIQEKRLKLGSAAEIEVVQAQAGLTTRKSDLISARSQVEIAGDRLKSLLGLLDEDTVAPKQITPTDKPEVSDVQLNEVQSTSLALKNRPEMASAELQIETAKIEQKRLANGLMPQFDITGGVSQGGRGHFPSDVFYGIRDRSDNSYNVGFQGSVPIGNRAAIGQYERAKLTTRQTQQQLEQAKQTIILNVQLAVNNVATSRVLVESTKQTMDIQEINLEAEEKRLELGVTTSYRVLEIEADMTAARTQHIQALVNYQKALTDLRLAEGALLDTFEIKFEAPEPEKPVSYLRSILPVPVK